MLKGNKRPTVTPRGGKKGGNSEGNSRGEKRGGRLFLQTLRKKKGRAREKKASVSPPPLKREGVPRWQKKPMDWGTAQTAKRKGDSSPNQHQEQKGIFSRKGKKGGPGSLLFCKREGGT